MKTRVVRALVVVLLLGSVVSAQTLTELLQKGIYTQDTLGDLDAAIRIYQQVIAGTQAASDLRVQAQRRLQAIEAQRRLLAASRTPRADFIPVRVAGEPLGTLAGNLYRHTWTGVTFTVPDGWTLTGTNPSSDDGEMATLTARDPSTGVAVWMKKEDNDSASVDKLLNEAPIEKVGQRPAGAFQGYRMRERSVQRVYIGGQRATLAIADYTEPSGRAMAEYMTWIYTGNTRAFFFARVPPDELERLRPQFDAMVYSAIIP
jgi:hypothetical protein